MGKNLKHIIGKRYLVFAGPDYYPAKGFDDFVGGYVDGEYEKAMKFCEQILKKKNEYGENYDWSYIIDLHTGEDELFSRY